MSLATIQQRLDELEPGGTLALERGDYSTCVVSKPVILLCDGATFWTDGKVPAITIHAKNVVIKDANLRGLASSEHVVISVDNDCHPLLQNIRIFGRAVGVEEEPCEWILPQTIRTGEISPQHPGFYLDFGVPQRSQIVCRISGVSLDPAALSPGINSVKLQIQDAMPDSILIGEVEVIGSTLTRLIPFFARITASPSPKSSSETSSLIEIPAEEKERFQKGLAGRAAAGSQPSSTQKSPAAPQTGKQKTQSVPAVEPPQEKPARVNKPADKTQVNPGKRKSTPAVQEDPLKLGGAFAESAEEIRNIRRWPIYILVDCSGAMSGDPIESVMAAISALHSELMNDPSAIEFVYLSVISFGSNAKQVVPLTELASFTPPKLVASGTRAMGEALRLLCQELDFAASEKKGYRNYDNNYVLLITGGAPTDNWQNYADNLITKNPNCILALSCGEGSDTSHLEYIADTVLEMKNMSPSNICSIFRFNASSIRKSRTRSIETPSVYTSIDPNSPGKPSPLFGGNSLVDKPLDSSNRTESDQVQAKGDQHKASQTSHLSKLFSDPRD